MKTCITKLNATLRDFDTGEVTRAADAYRSRGREDKAANVAAVEDHLRELRQQRVRIERQVLDAWKERDPEGFAKVATPAVESVAREEPKPKVEEKPAAAAPAVPALEQPRDEEGKFVRAATEGEAVSREVIESVLSRLGLNAGITETEAELPKRLVDQIKNEGATGQVRGVFDPQTGKVWLVRSNIHSEGEAVFVALHESAHRGLSKVFGPDLKPVLEQIYLTNKSVRKAADNIRKQYGYSLARATEEALANMALRGEARNLRGWQRFLEFIRKWLVDHGFKINVTDAMAEFVAGAAAQAGKDGVQVIANNEVAKLNVREASAPSAPKAAEAAANESQKDEEKAKFSTTAPPWVTAQPASMQETLRKAGAWRPKMKLQDRIASWTDDWQAKLKQGMVDQFDPIKSLDYKAYMLARMSKSSAGPLESMLLSGTVYLDKDGAVDVNYEKGGFVGLMQKLQGEHDRFFAWVIGNRAERLMAEGKEHNFTAEDIANLKTLNQGKMSDGRGRDAVYQQALADLTRYNKAAVDMAATAGLVDAESRPLWEKDFYIPFYRMTEGDKVQGPRPKAGLVRQYAFKTLKGGAEAIGDPMENILKNWAHLIDASMKNNAARATILAAEKAGVAIEAREESAREMAKAIGKKDSVVFFTDQGAARYFVIDDPFVLDAINSVSFSGFSGRGMKVMGFFKHWLTYGVTISPTFRIRNVLRDSIAMIGANQANYNVLDNLLTGWKATEEGSPVYASMIAGGGVMRYGSTMDGDHGRNVKRLIDKGVDSATILNTPEKVASMVQSAYQWWMRVGDRSENINRAALYQKLRDEGKSHLEASYAARDVIDFSMQGTWAAIRFLNQTVPFMNARAQGLYKLGRGAVEDPRRFAYVIGATALASIALMLAYKDDEDWRQREDFDRESFWWFKIGNKAFRIPKPFEIGAIATLAERGLEAMITNDLNGRQFARRVGAIVTQQLSMNPIPQAIVPAIEVWANFSFFTDRAIETQGMEKLSKQERISPSTSVFAQLAGKNGLISPTQIDHLVGGYFGWLGIHAVMVADLALRPATGAPGEPTPKIDDRFVVGDFVRALPAYQSRYVTKLYEDGKKVQELMADLRHYQKIGAMEKAKEILEENRDKLRLYKLYTHAEAQLSQINSRIKMVKLKNGDPDVKRDQLDQLFEIRNRIAKLTEDRAREAETP